jgi:hypothetical protein
MIMNKHEELVHRDSSIVIEQLKKENDCPDLAKLVKEEIKRCIKCKMYNPKKKKKPVYVTSYFPGEKIAVDIVGPIKGKYIITGIDYFSRKSWAKVISSRESRNVAKFVDIINNELNI